MQWWAKHRSSSWSASLSKQKDANQSGGGTASLVAGEHQGCSRPRGRGSLGGEQGKSAGPDSPPARGPLCFKTAGSRWSQGEGPWALEHMPFIGNCSFPARGNIRGQLRENSDEFCCQTTDLRPSDYIFPYAFFMLHIKSWSSLATKIHLYTNDF